MATAYEVKRQKNREWYVRNQEVQCARARERYAHNREALNEKSRQRYAVKRVGILAQKKERKIALVALLGGACMDCGSTFPDCLDVFDFDHRDPTEKKFALSNICTRSWECVLEEVQKCDLVCANCHRVRTAARRHG